MMIQTKYKSYPAYKKSGVEWIGEIPEGWELKRIDWVMQYKKECFNVDSVKNKEVFYYSIPVIQETGDGKVEYINEISSDKILLHGEELLISKLNPRKGLVLISRKKDLQILCSTEFVPLLARSIDLKYSFYLYSSYLVKEKISSVVQSATYSHQRAKPRDIYKIWVYLPPLPEQQVIADFLDRETARINGIVEKQTRMIELLKEKRSALITKAVTKGLDPHVKLKPSGVEWIGEIPEGWEVRKVKFNTHKIGSGKTPLGGANTYVDEGILFIRSQNVHNNRLELEDIVFIDEKTDTELFSSRVLKYDVLLNITGASIGRTCIYNSNQRANVNQHVCIIRVNESKLLPNFLVYFLISITCQNYILNTQNGSSREALTFNQIGNLSTPFLPIPEQQAIADFLDRETAKIDTLIEKIERQIKLLNEYKQTLITSAVTGKIDVRGTF